MKVRDPFLHHCPSLHADAGTDIVSVAILLRLTASARRGELSRHRHKVARLLACVGRSFHGKRSLCLHHLRSSDSGVELTAFPSHIAALA